MTIVKRGKQYCVVSEHGGKNLGCSRSHGGAVKRLGQVEYFKHAHKSLTEDVIIKSMDDGSMRVDDGELLTWMTDNKSLLKSLGADLDDIELKSLFGTSDMAGIGVDDHVTCERLKYLLFNILAGAEPPDWNVQTFESLGVVTNDAGVLVKDADGCAHGLTVIMTVTGQTVLSAEQSAVSAGGGFDPELELAGDLVNYLNGDAPAELVEVREVPSFSYEDGAELVFSDGTVVDVYIRGYQKQASGATQPVTATQTTAGPVPIIPPVVTMQMMSIAALVDGADEQLKSAAVSYQCFDQMSREYAPTEAGEMMNKGRTLFDNGSYAEASELFKKARDKFDSTHYPTQTYWHCLDDWAGYANDLATQYPTAIGVGKAGTSEGAKKGWERRQRTHAAASQGADEVYAREGHEHPTAAYDKQAAARNASERPSLRGTVKITPEQLDQYHKIQSSGRDISADHRIAGDKPDADVEILNGNRRVVVVGRDGNSQYPIMDADGTARYDKPEVLSDTVKKKATKLLRQEIERGGG